MVSVGCEQPERVLLHEREHDDEGDDQREYGEHGSGAPVQRVCGDQLHGQDGFIAGWAACSGGGRGHERGEPGECVCV